LELHSKKEELRFVPEPRPATCNLQPANNDIYSLLLDFLLTLN